ncbi:MAG: hypothetical protein IPF99_30625 [Deltaproteobacteria bacterium]|nr:hypothetical protein [Deltaproteobacteria bacterium]MBK7068222.1 hypothetical protein [Deltaproteobacteria bacterium]MBP6830078.1 hypothetical protein [Deltaproteobacteria bacterium]
MLRLWCATVTWVLFALTGCDSGAVSTPADAAVEAGAVADVPAEEPAVDVPAGPDDPITGTTPNAWNWVPVDGMRCINDTPTGFGVSPSPGSDGLVIFFMGGGGCYNAETCESVFHGTGFRASDLRIESTLFSVSGPISRSDARNAFRTWNHAYIGYCTGDAHTGDNPAGVVLGGERRVFVGHRNVQLALRRLVATYPNVRRVLVTGVSAGGFGAAFNYDLIAQAFGPSVDVALLDDSGPPLNDDVLAPCLQRTWRTLWNLDATLPPDCTECRAQADGGGIGRFADFLARKYPTRRFGLITSTGDNALRYFFAFGHGVDCSQRGKITPEELRASLLATRQRLVGSGFRSYLLDSTTHT